MIEAQDVVIGVPDGAGALESTEELLKAVALAAVLVHHKRQPGLWQAETLSQSGQSRWRLMGRWEQLQGLS